MEAWSEDFNLVEKSDLRRSKSVVPNVQERHCPITTKNIQEEGEDAFLPLQLMLDLSTASHLKLFHGEKPSS